MDTKRTFLKYGWVFACLFFHWVCNAQIPAKDCQVTVDVSAGVGKVIKHSTELLFPAPRAGLSLQTTLIYRSSGKYDWQNYWKNPSFGANLIFTQLGNTHVLGNALGVFPSIRLSLPSPKCLRLGVDVGSGIAWASQHYNALTNPQNNALSLHWNNVTQFRLLISQKKGSLAPWKLGISLTHFSNGHIRLPNKGINQGGLSLSYSFPAPGAFAFSKKQTTDTILPSSGSFTQLQKSRNWAGEALFGIGFTEYSFEGGPPYQSYFCSGAVIFRKNKFVHGILGCEFEFNQSTFQFYFLDFEDRKTSFRKASRSAVFTGAGLNFGRLSVRSFIGAYLPLPVESIISSPLYLKLGLQYHLLSDQKRIVPSLGIYLKSHAAVAQYLALTAGCTF